MWTYGQKKPLEAKEEKLQKLFEENKRYYPTTKNGNVDEWGAVIKHQAEQFELHRQHEQQIDQYNKKKYYDDLNKTIERKKQEKDLDQQIKQRDLEIQQEYKRMSDIQFQQMKEKEKLTKQSVTSLNKLQINDVQLRNQYQKEADRVIGQQMIEEANKQKQSFDDLMKMKRDTFQTQIKQDLQDKQRLKEYDKSKQQLEKQEVKKLQEYNTQVQVQREREFKERFERFNEQEKLKQSYFVQSLGTNSPVKKVELSNNGNTDTASLLQKIYSQDMQGQNHRRTQSYQTKDQIEKQLYQKQMIDQLQREKFNIEGQAQLEYARQLNQKEAAIKDEKRNQQKMYRDILDNQVTFNKQMVASFGNMTGVEKKLNKSDLLAWKHYDNNQYALIPGVQHRLIDNKYKKGGAVVMENPEQESKFGLANRRALNQSVDLTNIRSHNNSQSGFNPINGDIKTLPQSRNKSLMASQIFNSAGVNGPGNMATPSQNLNLMTRQKGNGELHGQERSLATIDRKINQDRVNALRFAANNILI